MTASTLSPESTDPAGHVGQLARGGVLNLAGTIVGGLAGVGLVLCVTNGFPQRLAGTLFACTSLFLIVTALSELGTDAGLARLIQRELVAGRAARARSVLLVALAPVLAISVVLGVVGWFVAPSLAGFVAGSGRPDDVTGMLRVLATLLPVATAYDVVLSTTRAYGTMRANVLVEKLGRLPGQILAVLTVQLLGLGPVWLAVAWALPYLPGLVAVVRWYARLGHRSPRSPASPSSGVESGGTLGDLARDFWRFTTPRALGRICQVALQRADIVLVAAMLGPRSAAVYTAATKFLSVGQLGTQAVQQVLQPQLSRLFAAGDLDATRAVYRTSTAWLMALAWPVYLVGAVGATLVLQVFGDGYDGGRGTLILLSLTMLVATACGPADTALLMAGRSRQSLGNSVAALVVDLALLVLLVPRIGILGAGIAWAAALVVRNLLPVAQLWRRFRLSAFGEAAAWVAGAALGCFGLAPLVAGWVAGVSWPVMLTCVPVAGVAYVLILLRARDVLALSAFRAVLPGGSGQRGLRLPGSRSAGSRLPGLRRIARRARAVGRVVVGSSRRSGTNLARRLGRAAHGLPLPYRVRVVLSRAFLRRLRPVEVPVERLLLGTQDGVTLQRYAHAFADLRWASTPVAEGPHRALLELAARVRAASGREPSDAELLASAYAEHARRCLLLTGRYFWATDNAGIVEVARGFLARAGGAPTPDRAREGGSGPRDPILVAPIRDSDCYTVLDGHHRVALAAHRGEPSVRVTVKRAAVSTPLQDTLDAMSWIGGKKELYQPLDAPELRRRWVTVRRCTDRLQKMELFCTARGLARTDLRSPTYLDVACCYGWFVARMGERGFLAEGIERDPLALELGPAAYGLDPGQLHIGDGPALLRERIAEGRRYDVVSCFSLLHHFVLGRGGDTSAEELVRLLGEVTRGVLFLDTGQEHERWFARSLAGWGPARVAEFLRTHGDFAEVVDLGPDADAVPPYADNYGRHLFACVR